MNTKAVWFEKIGNDPEPGDDRLCALVRSTRPSATEQQPAEDSPALLSTCFVVTQTAEATKSHVTVLSNEVGALLRLAQSCRETNRKTLVLLPRHVWPTVLNDLKQLKQTGIAPGSMLLVAADGLDLSAGHQQDSRILGRHIPVLEPVRPAEACRMAQDGFAMSEEYNIPVLLRLMPGICQANARTPPRGDWLSQAVPKNDDTEDSPLAMARAVSLANFSDQSNWNLIEPGTDPELGFIVTGNEYRQIRAAYPHAPLLKLGLSFPLALKKIRGLIAISKRTIVVETGLPFLEDEIRAEGFRVEGREALDL